MRRQEQLKLFISIFRRPFPMMAFGLLVAGIISDFYVNFWNRHALLTNIISSFLMLALGLAVFDEWFRRREQQRWARVGNICLKSLAQTVVLVRDGLVYISDGKLPFPEEYASNPFAGNVTSEIERVKLNRSLGLNSQCDLELLMQSEDWVRAAYAALRSLSRTVRDSLASWAPIMIGSDRLSNAINRVGHLADAVEDLHRPFGVVHRTKFGITETDRREKTIELIDLTLTFSIVLEEWLTATMGRRNWKTRGRELLSAHGIQIVMELDTRHRRIESVEGQLARVRDGLRMLYHSAYETAAELQGAKLRRTSGEHEDQC